MKNSPSSWVIHHVHIVLEDRIIAGSAVIINGLIHRLLENAAVLSAEEQELPAIDGAGGYLLPGFIDVHVHGGFGADFMDASRSSYDTITRFHASQGTTGMLATTMTASKEAIESVLHAAADYRSGGMPYAALLGIHLEGPFLNEKWIGAQNPAYLSPPRQDWLEAWTAQFPDLIQILTLAPEREGSLPLIAWLAENNIVAACGHTDASFADIEAAADAGLSHAVHTYNAMRPLHHREPGTVGAVLSDPRICAELIADGHHVHPGAIRLLAAAKPADKLILITDAMSAAGMPDGNYSLGGLAVEMKDQVARLQGSGSLAGSSLTMLRAFRYMLANTALSVAEVSRCASGNAAKQLGIYEQTGSIACGKQADVILTDADFSAVSHTWVNGKLVFDASQN
ncbi:N-acetylglucosamine-6-phosphate deacetylase [Paenibacillus sp. BIHB 4019]|uniref:N-acetylglucosamine-6-phosphate deacetylase n=1 Tax=Paenibacillus sp. BIHB 4019 TaxID=1870819 RepID=A0A1B2DBG3_9BACL|nr:N-acetylglucosamine-6-phosphate deacetylase [Paenibacillus sp. BIHB 4019]ANY65046.1 N-acetylglucosamine-6-phosphate deacetylase [Paenibacillus sp. BIHB 4019]